MTAGVPLVIPGKESNDPYFPDPATEHDGAGGGVLPHWAEPV